MFRKLTFASMTFGAIFLFLSQADAACGNIEVAKGDVKIKSGTKLTVASVGARICSGDTILTSANSRAKLKMEDGNELNVSPESQIVLEKYEFKPSDNKKRVLLNILQGKVRAATQRENMYNDSAKDGQANTFQVRTKSAVAGVRGTDFLTGFDPSSNKTEVVTFKGKVEVGQAGAGGQILNPVTVGAGQKTEALPGQPPAPPRPVPKQELDKMSSESKADTNAQNKENGAKENQKSEASNDKDKKNDQEGKSEDQGDSKQAKESDKKNSDDKKAEAKEDKQGSDKKADGKSNDGKGDSKSADKGNDKGGDKKSAATQDKKQGPNNDKKPAAENGDKKSASAGGADKKSPNNQQTNNKPAAGGSESKGQRGVASTGGSGSTSGAGPAPGGAAAPPPPGGAPALGAAPPPMTGDMSMGMMPVAGTMPALAPMPDMALPPLPVIPEMPVMPTVPVCDICNAAIESGNTKVNISIQIQQ